MSAPMPHLDWPQDVRRAACATPCVDPGHHVCPAAVDYSAHSLRRIPGGGYACERCGAKAGAIRAYLTEHSAVARSAS
jgi:hypothetical protein